MNKIFITRFFDGNHIQPIQASVSIEKNGIKIHYQINGTEYEIFWPDHSLQLMERIYQDKHALIGSKTMVGARLVVEEPSLYAAIMPLILKKNVKLSHVEHPWRKAWLLGVAVFLLITLPIWHFHTIALWIANLVPFHYEQKFWANLVQPEFENYSQCVNPSGQEALQKIVNRLAEAGHIRHPIDVRVIDAPTTTNAESAPGFHIFLYSGLFKMNDPDAIAAVIAHELGHSVYQHVMAKYISMMGLSAFFKGLLGLSPHNAAFDFINLKYSRDYETQSDIFAIKLLKSAKINPAGFQYAMEYLQKVAGEFQGIEPYLIDHPTHQDRIDLIKNNPDQNEFPPSLTAKEWENLKNICHKTQPMRF